MGLAPPPLGAPPIGNLWSSTAPLSLPPFHRPSFFPDIFNSPLEGERAGGGSVVRRRARKGYGKGGINGGGESEQCCDAGKGWAVEDGRRRMRRGACGGGRGVWRVGSVDKSRKSTTCSKVGPHLKGCCGPHLVTWPASPAGSTLQHLKRACAG